MTARVYPLFLILLLFAGSVDDVAACCFPTVPADGSSSADAGADQEYTAHARPSVVKPLLFFRTALALTPLHAAEDRDATPSGVLLRSTDPLYALMSLQQ